MKTIYRAAILLGLIHILSCEQDSVEPKLKAKDLVIGGWNVNVVFGEIEQDTLLYGDILIAFDTDSMIIHNNTNSAEYFHVGTTRYFYRVDSVCWFSFESECPAREKREVLYVNDKINTLKIDKDTLRFGQLYVDGFDYILTRTETQ